VVSGQWSVAEWSVVGGQLLDGKFEFAFTDH
jgi:hypothetical protein